MFWSEVGTLCDHLSGGHDENYWNPQAARTHSGPMFETLSFREWGRGVNHSTETVQLQYTERISHRCTCHSLIAFLSRRILSYLHMFLYTSTRHSISVTAGVRCCIQTGSPLGGTRHSLPASVGTRALYRDCCTSHSFQVSVGTRAFYTERCTSHSLPASVGKCRYRDEFSSGCTCDSLPAFVSIRALYTDRCTSHFLPASAGAGALYPDRCLSR